MTTDIISDRTGCESNSIVNHNAGSFHAEPWRSGFADSAFAIRRDNKAQPNRPPYPLSPKPSEVRRTIPKKTCHPADSVSQTAPNLLQCSRFTHSGQSNGLRGPPIVSSRPKHPPRRNRQDRPAGIDRHRSEPSCTPHSVSQYARRPLKRRSLRRINPSTPHRPQLPADSVSQKLFIILFSKDLRQFSTLPARRPSRHFDWLHRLSASCGLDQ